MAAMQQCRPNHLLLALSCPGTGNSHPGCHSALATAPRHRSDIHMWTSIVISIGPDQFYEHTIYRDQEKMPVLNTMNVRMWTLRSLLRILVSRASRLKPVSGSQGSEGLVLDCMTREIPMCCLHKTWTEFDGPERASDE